MRGLSRTVADILVYYLRYHPQRDDGFDRAYGTDTAGFHEPTAREIEDDVARTQAITYIASPETVTRWALNRLPIDPSAYSFVDFGCGKGRILLVASTYPFRRVLGIEISDRLAATARANVEKFRVTGTPRCGEIEIRREDARQSRMPDGNLILHFYHPFGQLVLHDVLRRLAHWLDVTRRRFHLMYLCPTVAAAAVEEALASYPIFGKVEYFQSSCSEYDWLICTNASSRQADHSREDSTACAE